jgi:hypothetical protein
MAFGVDYSAASVLLSLTQVMEWGNIMHWQP